MPNPQPTITVDISSLPPELQDILITTSPISIPYPALAELIAANEYGHAVYHNQPPHTNPQTGLLPTIISIGNVILHSPTIASTLVLETWASLPTPVLPQIYHDNPNLLQLILNAYCCTYASDPTRLAAITNPLQAWPHLATYALDLTCTQTELNQALDTLTKGRSPIIYTPPLSDDDQTIAKKYQAARGQTPSTTSPTTTAAQPTTTYTKSPSTTSSGSPHQSSTDTNSKPHPSTTNPPPKKTKTSTTQNSSLTSAGNVPSTHSPHPQAMRGDSPSKAPAGGAK